MSTISTIDYLTRLGLNKNEAKVFDALISLGPVGAFDIHKYSDVPRNKTYESLENLAKRGMIEVQPGRPSLYRAIRPRLVVDTLIEDYEKAGKQVLTLLESRHEEAPVGERGEGAVSAWVVRGEQSVKKRLAELIYSAKNDIFAIGGYPPKYLLSAKSALKAATQRGIKARAVCMIRPIGVITDDTPDRSIIEYRTIKAIPTLRKKIQPHDEKIISGIRGTSAFGGVVIIDEETAFDIVDEGKDPKGVTGILMKVPGVPLIQKATIERILALYTRKIES